MTLEVRIQETVMILVVSLKGLGLILELQTGDSQIQHEEQNKVQKHWTNNKKEKEAIFLGLFRYGQ
ncbi:MAG: hypothetical protein EZS28_027061, partial [Streblomastix strix]